MDCVNHSGVPATAYCQSCGKALCSACVRTGAAGQVLCEPCFNAWQTFQQPFVPHPASGPNPSAAAILGLIPGVGAMYNGQFFKGLIHVVIFAVLVSASHVSGIFGIFIGAWILYQSFEAFHTAKAMRDGQPVPDPLGLNEVGNWLNLGKHPQPPGPPPAGMPSGPPPGNPGPYTSGPYTSGPVAPGPVSGPAAGAYQPPYTGTGYQTPYQAPYQAPYAPPATGYVDPAVPPVPPGSPDYVQPLFWRRKEPIGAVILIALGLLFLLGQMDIFHGRLVEFTWPLVLIGLGVWLVLRRLNDSRGGSK